MPRPTRVALGFFAAAGVLPPTQRGGNAADEAKDADHGKADAEPLAERAPPREPRFPLLLEPFPCAPALSFSAPRQGCRPPIYRD